MKSGSISATQFQSERSKLRYLPLGAVIASKAAVESSARCFSWMPIFLKSGWRIWNVRLVLGTSVGVITSYDILCPLATRIPPEPFLKPARSRILFASARLKLSGLTAGLYQPPVAGGMIDPAGDP